MAQIRRIVGQVDINCEADKFFNVWSRQVDYVSKVCPDKVPSLKLLHGGTWNEVGAKQVWTYVTNGTETETLIAEVENVDEKARSVSYKIIEGYVMDNCYKSLKCKIEVAPNGEGRTIVKWNMEYEKMTQDGLDPLNKNLELLLHCATVMAAHI